MLDYSRFSRHLLVTAGDDGTVHLWDTTGRNPKVCLDFLVVGITWLDIIQCMSIAGIVFLAPPLINIIIALGAKEKNILCTFAIMARF